MIPLLVVKAELREDTQVAMDRQEAENESYSGTNSFQEGLGCVYYFFDEQFWLERLMLALMAAKIPFQIEYAERVPDAFCGFQGKRIEF